MLPGFIRSVIDSSDAGADPQRRPSLPQRLPSRPKRLPSRPAALILVEQSGVKWEIPQPSAATGIMEAEQAMHRHGSRLREVKVVSRHRAIARWKPGELGWQRVA